MKLTNRELKNFYQGEYVAKLARQPIRRISRLLSYVDFLPDDVVADYACGDGILLTLIHERVKRYVGIDFSKEFIANANERLDLLGARNAQFVCSDIVDFCKAHPNEFDKAFTLDFSEHIYDEDFLHIYSGIRDSLKHKAKLYLHTPNADFLLEILKAKGILAQFPEHVAVRNANSYRSLLRKAGFQSIRVFPLSHYKWVLFPLHSLSYLPGFGRYFQARLFITCEK